ncbi:hypothetical protein BJX76DRAFT_357346 [Aspergillus varians]
MNSTALEAIFACTWTVLHQSVPGRNKSERLIIVSKLSAWMIAFLAPEALVLQASDEFWRVWSLASHCNGAQASSDRATGEPDSWLYNRTKPLTEAHDIPDLDLYPLPARSTHTGSVLRFHGARDQGPRENRCLSKAFTVCQSAWVTVNIVARAGYKLPITPIEFSTLAYIACAAMTYAFGWHTPQDMAVPITLPLRYTRDGHPEEIQILAASYPRRWIHRRVILPRQRARRAFLFVGRTFRTLAVDQPVQGVMTGATRELSLREESWLNTFAGLAGFLFCGIHVAAWKFPVPSHAEAIAWRVFSLTALAMVVIVYVSAQAPLLARWVRDTGVSLPGCMHNYADANGAYTKTEIYLPLLCMVIYTLVRLGLAALTLSSLRALPGDAYVAVDWLGSIPHI